MIDHLPGWLTAVVSSVFPSFGAPPENIFNGYTEADYVYVAPAAAGRIDKISVEQGERVFQGQQLYALDKTSAEAAMRAAQARVHVAEANLANLQTGSRDQEIAVIRAELARAEAQRDLAANTLSRSERLFDQGNVSRAQVDTDRATLASAEAQVAELQAQLKVAELPARDAQRIAAEATLDAARADAEAARSAFEDRIILSPATGLVDSRYFGAGEVAGAGVPVLSILPDGALRAIFFVPEGQRAAIAIGDRLAVTCTGCKDGLFATVTRLASDPQYTPPIIYSREERHRLVFRAEAMMSVDSGLLPGQPIVLEPQP